MRCYQGKVRGVPIGKGASKMGPFVIDGPISIQTPAGFLFYNGKPYREELRVFPNQKSGCEVVNVLDIEKYLDGLVNAEFSSRWNLESVKAQVVAARTYALFQSNQARKNLMSRYDVVDTVHDQVYSGSYLEDYRSSRGVKQTRGMILTPGRWSKRPIKAFYHSTCGGQTQVPEKVWTGSRYKGFKRGVICRFCKLSPTYRWKEEVKSAELKDLLVRTIRGRLKRGKKIKGWPKYGLTIIEKGSLLDLAATQHDNSGRVMGLQSVWKVGKKTYKISIPGSIFRRALGVSRLKSTAFQVQPEKKGSHPVTVVGRTYRLASSWVFQGKGFGHGVGMCQYGAKFMGETGYSVDKILRYYYPDARLRKIW